ncbi:MAG TPA: hypothetical protein VFN26_06265 [Candidatus Acidoferrum sp.]|nr:hypothetical protein [Candidatus Acidoferrum sp.]
MPALRKGHALRRFIVGAQLAAPAAPEARNLWNAVAPGSPLIRTAVYDFPAIAENRG